MALKFFNLLFRIFLIFLICLIWVRYFVRNLTLALIYTLILTISIELLIHLFLGRKIAKNKLKKEEEKLAEKISSNFIYEPARALDYFYKLASINYNAKKQSKFVILQRKNETEKSEKTIIFPKYSFNSLGSQDLVEIIKKTEKFGAKKIIVCCYKISAEVATMANKIPDKKIVLLDSKATFIKLVKPYNFYPEDLKEIEFSTKPKFKEILKASISKKRAKGYLVASLILLFSSFIIRMNIYYVVFSSILLLLSLVSFFFPPKSLKYEDEVL